MNQPLVSIVIPTYNRAKLLLETIKSVQEQTYKNIEIIISDNCSEDDTRDLVLGLQRSDSRIQYHCNEKNLGPVQNWRKGIEVSAGEYVKLLFSDDLINEEHIKSCLEVMTDDIAFVLGGCQVFGSMSWKKPVFLSRVIKSNDFIQRSLLDDPAIPVSPACALFRKKDLLDALECQLDNPFDWDFNRYGAGNDSLIFLKIALKYPFIKTARSALTFFRAHGGSFTCANRLEKFYFWAKVYFSRRYNDGKFDPLLKNYVWLKMQRNDELKDIYRCLGNKEKSVVWLVYICLKKIFFKVRFRRC